MVAVFKILLEMYKRRLYYNLWYKLYKPVCGVHVAIGL